MAHYLLLMLTLNAQTGELRKIEIVGRPFETEAACLQAAIERGPQLATPEGQKVFSCKIDRQEITV